MNRDRQRIRRAGTIYAAGGAIWFLVIGGGQLSSVPWNVAHTTSFAIAEALFIVVQTLLLIGFWGIWWSGGVSRNPFGRLAFGLGALGHVLFVLVEIHSLLGGAMSPVFPLAPLTSAVGILLTGIGVLHAGRWRGWSRWLPLLTGLYPFLFMFPVVAITGAPSEMAIGFWGLVRLALGLAIRAQGVAQPATPQAATG